MSSNVVQELNFPPDFSTLQVENSGEPHIQLGELLGKQLCDLAKCHELMKICGSPESLELRITAMLFAMCKVCQLCTQKLLCCCIARIT